MSVRSCLIILFCCFAGFCLTLGCNCRERQTSGSSEGTAQGHNAVAGKAGSGIAPVPGIPAQETIKLGINFSGSSEKNGSKISETGIISHEFLKEYKIGVDLITEQKYQEAIEHFQKIIARFPNSEEAGIAEYCIAEIYFRHKSNNLALEAFKQIVEKYPNTQAAVNARAGIDYLETFSKHESEYVSPEVEDRKRRGN